MCRAGGRPRVLCVCVGPNTTKPRCRWVPAALLGVLGRVWDPRGAVGFVWGGSRVSYRRHDLGVSQQDDREMSLIPHRSHRENSVGYS